MATKQTPSINPVQWASDVLHGIGAPDTKNNRIILISWALGENTKARYNPLATTQIASGATPFNTLPGGGHVYNYPDYKTGVQATTQTLLNGYYPQIVSDLRVGSFTPQQFFNDVNVSHQLGTWGTGDALAQAGIDKATFIVNANGSGFSLRAFIGGVGAALVPGGIGNAVPGLASGIGSVVGAPGAAAGAVGKAASGVAAIPGDIASGAETVAKDILYGIILVVCTLTFLVGIILIGADIGIGVLAGNKATKTVGGAYGKLGGRIRRSPPAEDETVTAYREGVRQGQISRARSEGRKVGAGRMEKQKVVSIGDRPSQRAKNRAAASRSKGPGKLPAGF